MVARLVELHLHFWSVFSSSYGDKWRGGVGGRFEKIGVNFEGCFLDGMMSELLLLKDGDRREG